MDSRIDGLPMMPDSVKKKVAAQPQTTDGLPMMPKKKDIGTTPVDSSEPSVPSTSPLSESSTPASANIFKPYTGFFGADVSAAPKLFNKQFEDLTGYRDFDLSEPTKPVDGSLRGLLGSDLQKKREESYDDKKNKVYVKEASKIDELANKVHGGVLSLDGSDIIKAAQNPYSQNVIKSIVSEYKPEVANDLTNPVNAEAASLAINAKNRINSVNAESAQIAQYDTDIQNSWGVLKNDNPPVGVDNFTKETVDLKKNLGVPNLQDNSSISAAISQLQEIQNRDKIRFMGLPLAAAKSYKETEDLIEKLRNRININTKDTSPNISWLNDKINQAVVGQVISDGEGDPEKDNVRVQQFKLGLSAIEYSDPVLFKNVTQALAQKSKVSPSDYTNISRVGQDIYNKNVFKSAAVSPEFLGKETNFDYTTFEEKKAKAAGDIGEWMKSKGIKNTFQFSEKSIMQAAKELGIDKNIAQKLALEEALPAYDAIPKSGMFDDLVQGMQQPIAGLLSTIQGMGETPAETYLRSKQLGGTGMAQKVPTSDGYGTTLNSEKDGFWTGAIQGLGQFVTQVALAKGAGVFGKGGAELLKLGAKGAEIATVYGGTAIPIYLQTYGQSYEQYIQETANPAKASLMAHIASVLETSSEMWLPDVKIADMAAKGFKKEAVDGLFSLINKGGDPADIALKSRSIIGKFLKETANIGVQEIGEEVYSQIGGYMSQMILDPNSALKRDLNDEVWQTIKQTAISMALPAILGGGGSAMQRDFSVKTLHSAAINFDQTKEGLEKQKDNGIITQEELDSAIKLLSTHKESVDSAPTINANGVELNSKQKLDYALESTKVKVYNDKISESKDAVQKEMWEAKKKAAEEVQRGILMPKEEAAQEVDAQEPVSENVPASSDAQPEQNTQPITENNEAAQTENKVLNPTTEAGATTEANAIVSKETTEATGTGVVAEKPLTAKEKAAKIKLKSQTGKLWDEAVATGKLGVFASMPKEDAIKMVAEQAQNVSGGKVADNKTGDAYNSAVNQFGEPLVKKAIELHPLESLVNAEIKPEVNPEPATQEQGVDNSVVSNKIDASNGISLVRDESSINDNNNNYWYDVYSEEGKRVGNVEFNYREDLDGYQISSSKINETEQKKGIGTNVYKTLIQKLDKPLYSDSSRTESAERLWKKLEKEGFAKYDEPSGKYISELPKGKQKTNSVVDNTSINNEPNTETTKPVSTTIPAAKEKAKGQEDKAELQSNPNPTGQGNAETATTVLKGETEKQFKDGEVKTDSGSMPVDEYISKAKSVLNKLFPDASFEAYESTADYLDAGGHFGSRGVSKTSKDGSRRILLNVERLREVDDGRTAFHEIIHPIVDEVLGESREELDPLWLDIYDAMKDVKGFDNVMTHVVNYPEAAQSVEGITELLANIADGKISLEGLPEAKKNTIIELLNKLFEKLGLSVRFGDDYDFKSFASDIKTALQTGEMDTLKSVVDDRAAKNERARKSSAKIDKFLFGSDQQMKESQNNFQQDENVSEDLKDMIDLVQTYMEENKSGLTLKEAQDKVAEDWGDRSQDALVEEAYNEASKNLKITGKESASPFTKEGEKTSPVANELSTQFTRKLNSFVDKLFGKSNSPEGHVVVLKNTDALKKAAANIQEQGGVAYQITMPDGSNQTVKPINADVVNGFYSPLEKTINETKFDKLPAKQWVDKFAKGEEAKWTGLTDWLKSQDGSVSKSDIQQYLKDNRIQIVEVVKNSPFANDSATREEEMQKIKEEFDNNDLGYTLTTEMGGEMIVEDREGNLVEDQLPERLQQLAERYYQLYENNLPQNAAKFTDYQLKGAKENYKEVLVTMPDNSPEKFQGSLDDFKQSMRDKYGDGWKNKMTANETKSFEAIVSGEDNSKPKFKSAHFSEPNILVHLRMNTRLDSEGNKILMLEEIQSDFAQLGRKNGFMPPQDIQKEFDNLIKERDVIVSGRKGEYSEKEKARLSAIQDRFNELHKQYPNSLSGRITAVPEAPFVTDTNSWVKLGLKTALKEAVKQGAKKIAWTNGEQQNERYDLSKVVSKISYSNNGDGTYSIRSSDGVNVVHENESATIKEIEDTYGKDIAAKVSENFGEKDVQDSRYDLPDGTNPFYNEQGRTIKGDGLKAGGKGMVGFYGNPSENKLGIVGNVAKSLFKQDQKTIELTEGKWKEEDGRQVFEGADGTYIGDYSKQRSGSFRAVDMFGREKIFDNENDAKGYIYNSTNFHASTQHSIDITPELKAQVGQGLPLFMYNPKGEILGFTDPNTGRIFLNGEKLNPNTPMHEAGHLFLDWAEKNNENLFNAGIAKIKNSKYLAKVKAKDFYKTEALKQGKEGSEAYERYMQKEALAHAIGDSGAQFFMETQRSSFKAWANKLWEAVGKYFGIKNKTPEEIRNMTLSEFTKGIAADILNPDSTFEKKAQKKTEPKVTPVDLTDVDSTDNTTSITHASMQDLADEFGFDNYIKNPESIADLDAEAAQVLERDGEEAIKKIFRKITENGDPANNLENRMLLQYVASLRAKFAKNPMNGSVLNALKQVREMVNKSNSMSGKNLQSIKGQKRVVDTLDNWMLDKMESLGLDELPKAVKEKVAEEFNKFKSEAENSQKVTKEYEDAKTELAAELEVKDAKKQRSIIRRKSIETLKKERANILSHIKEKLAQARNKGNVTIVPYAAELTAIAPDITKLIRNIVESGIVEFDGIVDNIHELLKDEIQQITKKDVVDLMGGKYSKPTKTKDEIETRVSEIKREAKLLDELERLQAGEEPKDVNKSIKRNRRIKELSDAIKELNPGNTVSALKSKYETEIEQLQEDLKNRNYTAKKKLPRDMDALMEKTNPELWKRTMDARIKRDELRQQWEYEKHQDEWRRRNWMQKTGGFVAKLIGTSQAIKAGIDDSVTFIQLGAVVIANPRLGVKAKIEAIKDMNDTRFKRQLAALHASAMWDLIEKSGLDISEPHSMHKERMEEMFRNNLIDTNFKIKGKQYNLWTNTGGLFERLFTSMANNMRLGLFMSRVEVLRNAGKTFESHPQEYIDAANAINNLTARAKLGKHIQQASPIITPIIWAPQMLTSSINLLGISDIAFALAGKKGFYGKLSASQRKFAFQQMGRAIGVGVLVMAAAAANGWEPDKDPTSSTFGTILVGQTRYSVFGRFTTIVKTIMQIMLSKKTTDKGVQDLNSGKFGGNTGGTILGSFFRGKMTPAAGFVYDYKFNAKKNYFTYEPITLDKVPDLLITPMAVDNIKNGLEQDGAWSILTRSIPAIEGINIYDKRDWQKFNKPKKSTKSRSRVERSSN